MLQEVLSLDQMLTDADKGLNKIGAVLTRTIYTFSTCNTVSVVQPIISWNIHHVYRYRQSLLWMKNLGADHEENKDPVILI